MDSSLPQQMVEKNVLFRPFLWLFSYLESLAIKEAEAVVPVCEALSELAKQHGAKKVCILQDIPLLESPPTRNSHTEGDFDRDKMTMMYIGNLEAYQGIDLLLESFSRITSSVKHVHLVIVGGTKEDIQHYQQKSQGLGIETRVSFLGAKPIDQLALFLAKADILVSPRTKGNNTPMKLYSYLQSGKPIVATNLPTHTQVLHDQVAILANPNPESFAQGMLRLILDPKLCQTIGEAGRLLVEKEYSFTSFRSKVNELYDWLTGSTGSHSKRENLVYSSCSSNQSSKLQSKSPTE